MDDDTGAVETPAPAPVWQMAHESEMGAPWPLAE